MANLRIGRTIIPLLTVLMLATLCQACPTCRNAIAENVQQAGIIRGYFWSILFMMSMPFLILGGLSAYFYYQVRQARATQNHRAAAESAVTVASHTGP
jgi:heme/copper-type cytochrome/quinol oxidase subunit 2